jgi:hypothetical protein
VQTGVICTYLVPRPVPAHPILRRRRPADLPLLHLRVYTDTAGEEQRHQTKLYPAGAGGEGRGARGVRAGTKRGSCTPRLQTQYQLVLLSCTTVLGSRTSSRCSCGSSSAAVKFFPPSKEHSTRQIPRPAPLHAIPRSVMLDTPLAPERTVLVLGSQRMLCTCGQRFHRDLVLIGL